MSGIPITSEVLGAMITPAVLISASGVLVLSTSNRVGRTVDRVRVLAAEVERLRIATESTSSNLSKRRLIAEQLSQLSRRAVLLRSAMTALYTAIGLLVGTSILVGGVSLLQWRYSSFPLVSGFAGACALLYGSLLLVREARLALRSTLQEVAFAQEAVLKDHAVRFYAETAADRTRRKNDSVLYPKLVRRGFFKSNVRDPERRK